MSEAKNVTVYLEPAKQKYSVAIQPDAIVEQVVHGMVEHMDQTPGFDLSRYLNEKIGDGFAAEWQLFREKLDMQLLPPGTCFRELDPPLQEDETFTVKVNAKVA